MCRRLSWLAVAIFARRLLVGMVLLYVGVVLLLGGTASAKPVLRVLAGVWVVGLSWHNWRTAGRPSLYRPFWHAAEIVVTNLALMLLLGELGLRTYALARGDSLLVADTLDAHRLMPGRDYGHGLRGNYLGYPGPDWPEQKPAGIRRIAALGDSFAVGPAVPFADNYLTVLETLLPDTEVCNFGVSGAGPREYLHILRQDVWRFQPDCILVSLFVGNDITEELATPRRLDPRQHALYLLGERTLKVLKEHQQQVQESASTADRLDRPALSPQTFRAVEARRLAVCLQPVSVALEKKWRRALADLDGIIAECRAQQVPLAFVLIPDEFQVNPAVLAEAVRTAGMRAADVDVDLPQRRLRAFCEQRGVKCLDLLPLLAGVPDTYAPRDTHWNVRGNRLAAEAVSQWLGQRDW
jgi:hypothetical protein